MAGLVICFSGLRSREEQMQKMVESLLLCQILLINSCSSDYIDLPVYCCKKAVSVICLFDCSVYLLLRLFLSQQLTHR